MMSVLKYCNCADCGQEIAAPYGIGGRIKGRPYCVLCIEEYQPRIPKTAMPATKDDIGPWQEYAIRVMEGD